ncbi:MAG: SpoIIE family protein phosphatase [Streptosporangiaceae bacterium]|nr:SpoIIE family protein phosphatase [Streptosporangiaceae bacterium]
MAAGDDQVRRLAAVIDRQRRELDRLRAEGGPDSVIAMARGALMERLGLSAAEAARQLAELSEATGTPLAEMAATVLGSAEPGGNGEPGGSGGMGPPQGGSGGTGSPPGSRGGPGGFGGTGSPPQGGSGGMGPPGSRGGLGGIVTPGKQSVLAEAAAETAADGTELVGMLAEHVLPGAGADAALLWLLQADGALELLGQAGLPSGEVSRWRHVPPQLDCPAQRVAHDAADLWWHSGRPRRDSVPVVGRPDAAKAVLALREPTGQLVGVLEVAWSGPLPAFGTEVRQRLSALADGYARVLAARLAHGDLAAAQPKAPLFTLLDSLADSVLAAGAIRDDAGQVTDFRIEHVSPGCYDPGGRTETELGRLTLLEAYPQSVSGQGLFARAVQVLADGVPQHVPGALAGHGGSGSTPLADLRIARFFDGVIATWRREQPVGRLAVLHDHAQRLGRLGGWEENLVTGTVNWTESTFGLFGLAPRPGAEIPLAELHSYVIAADKPAMQRFRHDLLEQRETLTATFRVVHPEDRSIRQIRVFAEPVTDGSGTLVALRGAFQDVSAHYQTQVALAATRDQLADTEQRAAEEHLLATRLQRAIMPPDEPPAAAAGIDVAVRYRPVGEGHLVGGDWYDTLLLPGKGVLLAVGDVAGHGIDAVTGMVASRNSLRGLAITGTGPAELIRMLNGMTCHLISGVVGTALCGIYDPAARVLRWARAGHLPPVLVRAGAAAELPMPGGVLLGMDPDAGYEEAVCSLLPGDTLLLFTDGLIERRGEPIDDVLGQFAATVAADSGGGLTAAATADQVLARAASDTDDDACLVVVRIL